MDKLLNVPQVSKYLNISKTTIQIYKDRPELSKYFNIFNKIHIDDLLFFKHDLIKIRPDLRYKIEAPN